MVAIQICNLKGIRCYETLIVDANDEMEGEEFEGETRKDGEPGLQG